MQYGPVGVDGKVVRGAPYASISAPGEPLLPMPKSIIPPKKRRALWRPRRASTGAPFVIGNILYIQLGGTDQDYMNKWTRIERNIEADLKTQWPGESLVRVLGCAVWTGNASYPLYMDDLSFSNSMTTEHNVMGPGVIGHILRNRTTDIATYAATDRWFHYNQVGSVLSESDNTGALAQTHWQDAFGNTLASWSTGYLGGDKSGFHHNTKEYDVNVEMVYMYQRWYSAELSNFTSAAQMPRPTEHPYSFALNNPTGYVDVNGEMPQWLQDFDVRELSDFSAGMGDALTFGLTKYTREAGTVDPCSSAYATGEFSGALVGMGLGSGAAIRGGGALVRGVGHRFVKGAAGEGAALSGAFIENYGLQTFGRKTVWFWTNADNYVTTTRAFIMGGLGAGAGGATAASGAVTLGNRLGDVPLGGSGEPCS